MWFSYLACNLGVLGSIPREKLQRFFKASPTFIIVSKSSKLVISYN